MSSRTGKERKNFCRKDSISGESITRFALRGATALVIRSGVCRELPIAPPKNKSGSPHECVPHIPVCQPIDSYATCIQDLLGNDAGSPEHRKTKGATRQTLLLLDSPVSMLRQMPDLPRSLFPRTRNSPISGKRSR